MTSFVGRDEELGCLEEWYEDSGDRAVLLVHGGGGQGKTRLVWHFAETIRGKRGEQVLVLEARSVTRATVRRPAGDEGRGDEEGAVPSEVLLVVDEADLWPTGKLEHFFDFDHGDFRWSKDVRVRVLLTARSAGTWWRGMCGELGRRGINCRSLELKPLGPAGARELAQAAYRDLAQRMEGPAGEALSPDAVNRLVGAPAVSVELMALGSLLVADPEQAPAEVRDAVKLLLEQEMRYWAGMYGKGEADAGEDPYRIHLNQVFMARVVYVATLAGPLGHDVSQQMLERAGVGCQVGTQQAVVDHARCYPPPDLDHCLAPLAACVAEEFLGMFVPGGSEEMFIPADGWAAGAPFHMLGLLSPEEREAEEHNRQTSWEAGEEVLAAQQPYSKEHTFGLVRDTPAVLRLVRAAAVWPHLADRQLYPLARRYPKAVVMAGHAALSELREIDPAPPKDVLELLDRVAKECGHR
ncbi:ATP-binding protein [Streptomyces sp. GQFP]|uniref:ATP-binding protein n=1 Tax=Streptomyces sp. GQFP TaxID=2907545 RepID=UPI001F1FA3E4|nr:ATP-binding protein [Streptomyces sp. GQFP]UIX34131.1 ATP-binding protein [Streptomyces sp. GQFP]